MNNHIIVSCRSMVGGLSLSASLVGLESTSPTIVGGLSRLASLGGLESVSPTIVGGLSRSASLGGLERPESISSTGVSAMKMSF